MTRRSRVWIITAAIAFAAVMAAGCGDDDAGSSTTTHTHAEGMAADHSHAPAAVAADDWAVTPAVGCEVTVDPVSGYNLRLEVEGLTFAPEHAGLTSAEGQGHAHLYVDGEKVARLYGQWYHLTGLEPGTHEVKITLNDNSHGVLTVGGAEVADSVEVIVPAA